MEEYLIVPYDEKKEELWDCFVMEESINGNFLHTRRFLNYHAKDRFQDSSLLIYDKKGRLCAVCPACSIAENNNKIFYSHKGSTFGGIVFDKKTYCATKVLGILREVEAWLRKQHYAEAELKITPDAFSKEPSDLLQYCLYHEGYASYDELNLLIDYTVCGEDVTANFTQGKRRNIRNCEREGLTTKALNTKEEIAVFYEILCDNLKKYDLQPVHTLEELFELRFNRCTEEVEFFGTFCEDELLAGAMLFYFKNVNCAHTQYLCAKSGYDKLSPMTYLYYSIILEMQKREFHTLSWGITSEHKGYVLNEGLTRNKESYGSSYAVNRIYHKKLME